MDFIKKMASEQLENAMNGDNNNSNQNQNQNNNNQGYNQNQGNNQNQGYNQNQNQNQGYGQTGGSQYNSNNNGNSGNGPNISSDDAVHAANQHNSNGSENSSLFSTALGYLNNMNQDDNDVDEDKVQKDHQQAYNGNTSGMTSSSLGAAAALQALKSFTSGNSDAASGSKDNSSSGGGMQTKIIGMAMSEAAKLFDQSGGNVSGDKQDAVTSASQVIMKLMLKNQVSGMMGGSNSGGLGQLAGLVS
ncbi:hypothetical protein L202_02543 [Cryptococcus amylolentus CBS 6039]|uniref:DUF7721 domain-containing protein n=2 Tax=Cryptococcus amylolentus TaxID=104669 RepID=A0A1E3I0Y1_9TREE|nr:hypothetical protein L202_02543 [Cryptococcus amylolentus CBS 6039]ODN82260.1 hypothetical protein L202_02543 [Cryptococcus amylolentus CBS 6039]ODO09663.1 hypothetical protein I350_01876 [Cryptococcus amylolentus CBS 6273]